MIGRSGQFARSFLYVLHPSCNHCVVHDKTLQTAILDWAAAKIYLAKVQRLGDNGSLTAGVGIKCRLVTFGLGAYMRRNLMQ